MWLAVAVFLVALGLIATEWAHRTAIVIAGAALVVLFAGNGFGQEEAIDAVDFETIGLLLGMMVLVAAARPSGVFDWLAIRAGQLSRGNAFRLVVSLATTTAILSAFLDNLTTILLVVPVTFVLADALDVDPVPLVITEVVASNIGGTATLIGDPPNLIIAGRSGLGFNEFIVHLAPAAVLTFLVVVPLLYLMTRASLQVGDDRRDHVMGLDAATFITDRRELRRTVPILVLTIVAFFFHGILDMEPATVALAGAAAALLLTRASTESVLEEVEWSTLIFFAGLFVMVGALEHTGAIGHVADSLQDLTGGDRSAELFGTLWLGGIGSAVVDNIPFTTAMLPVVEQLNPGSHGAGDSAYWWALALGACFGGNATAIAAAANVAALGLADRAGRPISFMRFLKLGLPATLLSMLIATGYVAVRYVALA